MPMSSQSLRTKSLSLAGLVLFCLPNAAVAAQEPYGGNFSGWHVTQDIDSNGVVICRAFSSRPTPGAGVYRNGKGEWTLKISTPGVPKGTWEEASFEVGSNAEMVKGWQPGNNTVYLAVDDYMMGLLLKSGQYTWAVNGRRNIGTVHYDKPSLAVAVNRLRQCTKANGGK